MKTTGLFIIVLFLIISCGNAYKEASVGNQSYEEEERDAISEASSDIIIDERSGELTNVIPMPEKIVKTALLSMDVEDYKKTMPAIKKIVQQHKAYISTEEETDYKYMITNNLTIRVLSSSFEVLIDSLTGVAKKINHKNISSQDVSEEFVDIQARLKTKKEVENRYSELLKKANNIGDILQIEEKIRVIREEIEAKEGRLQFLNNQVAYSTINLTVNQTISSTHYEQSFWDKVGEAVSGGWEGLLIFFVGIMYLWPLWLSLAAGLLILIRFLKKRKRKK
jgi:hypothetical protein